MNAEKRTKWEEALAIIDDNLGIENGVISNRFATATKIIDFAESYSKSTPHISEEEIEKKFPTGYPLRSTVNEYKQEGVKWAIERIRETGEIPEKLKCVMCCPEHCICHPENNQ